MCERISVIIPAYNTEEYIEAMLECVMHQTYQNLEIIVVNDGSTDRTQNILERLAKVDSRIRVINVENGGVSRARNIGIREASGKKIFFWDSDDIIEYNTIEKCVDFSNKMNVNSVLYGYSGRINGVNSEQHRSVLDARYIGEEISTDLIKHFIGHSFSDINNWIKKKNPIRYGKEHTALWRIMLDTEIIKKNNISFDVNLSLGEDTKFINTYFLYEYSVGYLDECLYHLTIRANGANNTSNSNVKLMMENKLKLIDARIELDNLASKRGIKLHELWEGTMVLSVIQLLIGFATSKNVRNGYRIYKQYESNLMVREAISKYSPPFGLKAIPFLFVKYRFTFILYVLFKIVPKKLISRMI